MQNEPSFAGPDIENRIAGSVGQIEIEGQVILLEAVRKVVKTGKTVVDDRPLTPP